MALLKEKSKFKERLKQACDDSSKIPEFGRGRQVFIAKRLKITQEAVRKWFSGESEPMPPKMRVLADLLEVDVAWLALGIVPDMGKDARRKFVRAASGAVYMVTGQLMLEGGIAAWPSEADSRSEYVHIVAIIEGVPSYLHVSMGREIEKDRFEFALPRKYDDAHCVGFIPAGGPGRFNLIDLPAEMIEKHRQRKAGEFAVVVDRAENQYRTGRDTWPRFKNFREIL